MEIDLYTVSFLNAVGKNGFTSYEERGEKKHSYIEDQESEWI